MRRWLGVFTAGLTLLLISGIVFAASPTILKLGHGLPADHPLNQGAELFARLVEERTGGEVKVEVFPALQLGSPREQFEGLMAGTIDISIITTDTPAFVGQPLWRILEAGYVFRDHEHADAFFHGPLMQPLLDKLEREIGITVIDPYWYYGVRQLTTANKPIYKPEDLKGLKIRVPEAPGYLETVKGMGASPVPVNFGELYMALKMGVVDGQENPFATIYYYKYYEAQKYLMLTSHLVSKNSVFMSTSSLKSLTPEQQQIVREAILEAGRYNDQLIISSEEELLAKLKAEGMEVITPDVQAFSEMVQKHLIESWFTPEEREFFEKIQEVQ